MFIQKIKAILDKYVSGKFYFCLPVYAPTLNRLKNVATKLNSDQCAFTMVVNVTMVGNPLIMVPNVILIAL